MRIVNDVIFNSITSATTTSDPIDASYLLYASIQVKAAGSNPQGSLKVQVSNDKVAPGVSPSNFTDLTGATVSFTNNGAYLIPKFDCCYQFIRFVYTHTSSSGTITATMKGIGF